MIDEEEKQRYIEATKCDNCLQWHKHCNAECCRCIFLNIDVKLLDGPCKYITINPGALSGSDITYYKNHDVDVLRGLLRFKKERIEIIGNKVIYFWDCNKLVGNMCSEHDKNEPEICRLLTLETAKLPSQPFALTPNCLFKYKMREVKKNE